MPANDGAISCSRIAFLRLRVAILLGALLPAASAGGQSLTFTHLAGSAGGYDSVDGTGSVARFDRPVGVAVDASGNVYVADWFNSTIRKVTSAGAVTTLAGLARSPGSTDGGGSAARFRDVSGIAVDGSGNVYVADSGNSTIRKVTPAGVVTTLAGLAGSPGSADGTGSAARFTCPKGVAVDGSGNVFAADACDHTIRKVTPAGVVTTLAGLAGSSGSTDGTGSAARFNRPYGVAVDAAGNLHVADSDNHTIRKVTAAGTVTTLAGLAGSSGSADGTGSAARFYRPYGVAVDASGNVCVADSLNSTIRKVTVAGIATTLAGGAGLTGSADGTGSAARFFYPYGVGVDASGNVYVADTDNHAVRKVTATGAVTTMAGLAIASGSADGTGGSARFDKPRGVAVDASGSAYVADAYNHTIRRVTAAGVVTTLAGLAGSSGSADGMGSSARFQHPNGVAVDASGNVYVADRTNQTIRKVTAAGAVTTLAGLALAGGSADVTGSTARFLAPSKVGVDASGNVYVADTYNHTIRKVTPAGVVTTLAGSAGSPGGANGTGGAARFDTPWGLAVDASGNVYVADTYNHTIRKVTPAGVVTTHAGLVGAPGSTDGAGSAARFNYPWDVAVDAAGIVYVADTYNHTIRKVTPAGVVTTVGGLASSRGSTDGTGSAARFNFPWGVAIGPAGEVYVADTSNEAIRKGAGTLADAAVIDQIAGPVGQPRQLDTSSRTATSWLWVQTRIPTGSTARLSATSIRNPTFTPDVDGHYAFRLMTRNGSSTSITEVGLTTGQSSTATVSGGGTICAGSSATIQAALTGASPWAITWSDGVVQNGLTTSPATRTVSPSSTTTYRVTSVSNPVGAGTSGGDAVVTVNPVPATPSPTNDGPTCAGGTTQLTVGYIAGATYLWTGPSGFVSTERLPTLVDVTPAMAGPYSVSVSQGACTSAFGTTTVVVGTAPEAPSISAAPSLLPEQAFEASVPSVEGVGYAWTVTNGTLTAGQGTSLIIALAERRTPVRLSVVETSVSSGCSVVATREIPVGPLPTRYHPVTPCRLFDTRLASGDAAAAPALAPGETRTLAVGTRCGLSPGTARSLAVNLTVTEQTHAGEVVLYRGDLPDEPAAGSIAFGAGKTRANNGFVELSRAEDGSMRVRNRSAGSVHVVLDVSGVFR